MTDVLIPVHIDSNFSSSAATRRMSDLGYIIERVGDKQPPSMMLFSLEGVGYHNQFYLHDVIGEWLLGHGVQSHKCKLRWIGGPNNGHKDDGLRGSWILSVPDSIALLFKLTWGGK